MKSWVKLWAFLCLVLCPLVAHAGIPIVGTRVSTEQDWVRIRLTSKGFLRCRLISADDRRTVWEVSPARLASKDRQWLLPPGSIIENIRILQVTEDTLRITAATLQPTLYQTQAEEHSLTLGVSTKRDLLTNQEVQILLEKAKAADVIQRLRPLYPRVRFTQHPTMNGFYAQGTRRDVLQIKSEIGSLDRAPEPSKKRRITFLAVNVDRFDQARVTLQVLCPQLKWGLDRVHCGLKLYDATAEEVELAREILEEVSKSQEMVMLDVKLVSMTPTGLQSFGTGWFAGGPVPAPQDTAPSFQTWERSAGDLRGQLKVLIDKKEAKILASPRLGLLSGRSSIALIGDRISPGLVGLKTEPYLDVGLHLDARADLQPHDQLKIELTAEVATLFQRDGDRYPQICLHRQTCQTSLGDGGTLVIRGLLAEEGQGSAPLLNQLPVWGSLHRYITTMPPGSDVLLLVSFHYMR